MNYIRRYIIFTLCALAAAAVICFVPSKARAPAGIADTVRAFGPATRAALAPKSQFVETPVGYKPQAEMPQVPPGLKPAERQAWLAMARRSNGSGGLDITFPEQYSTGTVVRSQGMSVMLKPLGSRAAAAQIEDRKLVYHNAYASTDTMQVVTAGRSEEFLLLHDANAPQRFDYEISAMSGVKQVALKDNTIHFTNAEGRQLEIEAPWLMETGGKRVANAVHWELSYPNGPATPRLSLVVNEAKTLHYPVVIDPTWSATNSAMNVHRYGQTATLLTNGKVLVAGGDPNINGATNTAELYDPETGTWTLTGSLHVARGAHTATLLPNGNVLVAGGYDIGSGFTFSSAELYDPATGTWTLTGSMNEVRSNFTATLLPNGLVLAVGGGGSFVSQGVLNHTAEIYDPATGLWTLTGDLITARSGHTATLLPNGQVLVAGGFAPGQFGDSALTSSELYSPASGTWTATGNMATGRAGHTATLLQNGQVLAVAGFANGPGFASAELYNPSTGSWSSTSSLPSPRSGTNAVLMPNGHVWEIGGTDSQGADSGVEDFDPASGAWTTVGNLNVARSNFTATLLPNGNIVVAGGYSTAQTGVLADTELCDFPQGSFSNTGSLATARYGQTATLLPNGLVLVAGGDDSGMPLSTAELYDPNHGTWAATGSLSVARYNHTATLLPDGHVLVAGGETNAEISMTATTNIAELYDPSSGTWTPTGSMITGRINHTQTLLRTGQVLVAGGNSSSSIILSSAEIYSPATGSWAATGNLRTARNCHTATLLPSGQVLAAAGNTGSSSLASAELYDPFTGTWSFTGDLNIARCQHTANLLPNGQVLVECGTVVGTPPLEILASAELYNPATGLWTQTGSLNFPRFFQTSTVLANGEVLVTGGGATYAGTYRTTELYNPATGIWTLTGSLTRPQEYDTATLLPNEKVLIAGGTDLANDGTSLANAEIFDPGLGFGFSTQPQVSPVTSVSALAGLSLNGSNFTGVSEASSGGLNNSASNIPVLQLQSLANEQTIRVGVDPNQGFSATSLASLPPIGLTPGYALLTLFVNGTPSFSQIVRYSLGTQELYFPATRMLGLGLSPYPLAPTTSGDLTVTYTVVSGPATVSGNTLTLTGVGTVVLDANQPGNAVYAPDSATQSITVVAPLNYTAWETQPGFFTSAEAANPAIGAPTSAPEPDGVINELKYLFNINPARTMSLNDFKALPTAFLDTTTTTGTSYLAITYRQFALETGLTVNLQTSPDLIQWTTVTPAINQQAGTDPITGDPIMELGIVAPADGSNAFIRMQVIAP